MNNIGLESLHLVAFTITEERHAAVNKNLFTISKDLRYPRLYYPRSFWWKQGTYLSRKWCCLQPKKITVSEVIPRSLLAETAYVANLSFHYPYDFKIKSAKCWAVWGRGVKKQNLKAHVGWQWAGSSWTNNGHQNWMNIHHHTGLDDFSWSEKKKVKN